MAEPEAVWRVCRVIKGDCDFCPASEMVGGGACTRSCFAQAVECINTVETGNPWRKTEGVKAPWISASPAPEGGEEEEGLGSASASGDASAVSFAAANHEAAPSAAEAESPDLARAIEQLTDDAAELEGPADDLAWFEQIAKPGSATRLGLARDIRTVLAALPTPTTQEAGHDAL